jgi:bifunctional DNA-binding transcriptional regulator/antitoxin component of YhaV-PrlF toxin-antitoxin module
MVIATTKMSSRGQVVIPLAIREKMGLRAHARKAGMKRSDIPKVIKAVREGR